jgi:hypothetical protein
MITQIIACNHCGSQNIAPTMARLPTASVGGGCGERLRRATREEAVVLERLLGGVPSGRCSLGERHEAVSKKGGEWRVGACGGALEEHPPTEATASGARFVGRTLFSFSKSDHRCMRSASSSSCTVTTRQSFYFVPLPYSCRSRYNTGPSRDCSNRRKYLRVECIEGQVWEFVRGLLRDPERIRTGLDRLIE